MKLQVDVASETASLRALLYSAMQDQEIAQREAEQLELERVRRAAGSGASSSRAAEGSQSDLEDRLTAAVRRAEEAQTKLAERERVLRTATDRASQLQGQVDAATGKRDRLRIWAEAAERRLGCVPRIDELRGLVTTLGQAARSRSRTDVSGASGASIRHYLAGSSSRRRNEEERRRRGEVSAQSGRGGREMPPPPERQEGSGESGGG
ncbi:hypothetical protein Taro_052287 [Colocasia esculenta]|uniref:Uncharacterized protein n=1 Tax=Colocasia esculenta TaxID=4460 RepID=A0A843XIX4_COLES|nr:hypothetical protein [Colocasia esculenta]